MSPPRLRLVPHAHLHERAGRDAFFDRIGWQTNDAALPDDYEDRLAAQIFGASPAEDLRSAAPPRRRWLAVAVALLMGGGLAAAASRAIDRPTTQIVPGPAPERAPAPHPLDPGAKPSKSLADAVEPPAPDPGAGPHVAPRVGPRVAQVQRSTDRHRRDSLPPPLSATSSAAVPVLGSQHKPERRVFDEPRALAFRGPVVSPDGERAPPSGQLPSVVLPTGFGIAARPADLDSAGRWDHLAAAGPEGSAMAVVDIIDAGRLVSRL